MGMTRTSERQVTRLPFTGDAIALIEHELGVGATVAPYRVEGEVVWELRVPARWLPGTTLLVVLWPSIRRVDVRVVPDGEGPVPVAVTATGVHTVEVYASVEVMFRRDGGSVLFVTRDGRVAVAD